MNDQTHNELEQIKRRHSQLQHELAELAGRLQELESRLAAPPPIPPPVAPAPPIHEPVRPQAVPPPIPPVIPAQAPAAAPGRAASGEAPRNIQCLCRHCGGSIEFPPALVGDSLPCPHCGQPAFLVMESRPAEGRQAALEEPAGAAPVFERQPESSFELRVGTYWLARIGIVVLLTGAVLFGSYAYSRFIVQMGPWGKVCLLYGLGALLLAGGAWWQRQAAKESLRNYAQVLFAGGLALVYFTTYGAHHLEPLRVIEGPVLDGTLLLLWGAFVVWIADRKKSEVLALFAVGLAYYTSVITRVGSFTLYSNLILTIAAVFFLIRNRWAALSFGSVIASYASYAFWRFFDGENWHWTTPEQGLWHGTLFLVAYWIVFTAAVFLSRHETLAGPRRAAFLTLNNTQFFALFLITMLQVRHGGFWKFCLVYGAALLALSLPARRVHRDEPLTANSYLTQGLLLVTVALLIKYSGLRLALLLGAESVVLLTLGTALKNPILQIGAYLTGALATGWGVDGLDRADPRGLYPGAGLGAMMAFNAFWAHRQARADAALVRPVPAFFTILALIEWVATTWFYTSHANFPLALALEAALLTASIYAVRVREFVLFGQLCLAIGVGAWLVRFALPSVPPPWWNPALMMAAMIALSHWWQWQTALNTGRQVSGFWRGAYGLALVGVLYFWMDAVMPSSANWLLVGSALAIGLTVYGVVTRAWFVALWGQLFLLPAIWQFAVQTLRHEPEWLVALVPPAALAALSGGTVAWFRRRPDSGGTVREPLLQVALIYRWLALGLSFWWVTEYVPVRDQTWVLVLLGAAAFAWAGWRRSREALLFSAAFTVFGLALFWFPLKASGTVQALNVAAILVVLAEQQCARRMPERYAVGGGVQSAMILAGAATAWLLLGRWILQDIGRAYLTASWAGLALLLFGCGIVVRERMYRWTGLAVLACALVRVGLVDVWKLAELYRVLSFVALGAALLVLGFVYSKYQEKIREWL